MAGGDYRGRSIPLRAERAEEMIAAVIERCPSIDPGKNSLSVRMMLGPSDGEARHELHTFGTTVAELTQLREWIECEARSHVVMEIAAFIGIGARRYDPQLDPISVYSCFSVSETRSTLPLNLALSHIRKFHREIDELL
jgi:hypothetical protein